MLCLCVACVCIISNPFWRGFICLGRSWPSSWVWLFLDPGVAFVLQPAVTWPQVGGASTHHPLQPVLLVFSSAVSFSSKDYTISFSYEMQFSLHIIIRSNFVSLTLCLLSVCSLYDRLSLWSCHVRVGSGHVFFALFAIFAAEFRHIDCHTLTVQNKERRSTSEANGVWTIQEIHWGTSGRLWLCGNQIHTRWTNSSFNVDSVSYNLLNAQKHTHSNPHFTI